MPKYKVYWSKTYHSSGDVEVEAPNFSKAENIVKDNMGDYEGSMQYDPDGDEVEAYKWIWTKENSLQLKYYHGEGR